MQKVIYALWRRGNEDRTALNVRLRDTMAPALLARDDVRGIRLNLQDDDVVRAAGLRMRCGGAEQPDAVVQLWLDVAHDAFRAPIDALLSDGGTRIAAWLVMASTVIRNPDTPAPPGTRTKGFSQICFLKRPAHLDEPAWRHAWQGLHTSVAIETQANFEYIQNLIVRPLVAGPHDYAAIVEECFPADAMDDPYVFFDAVGDEAQFTRNTKAMADSCARFIGADCVDLLPTSQYDLRVAG
ncbi:EthD domain-containing protein [Sphingomonas sp. RP10(2022)]|uniref:EthD domain-containing protein n=1 Tax=Sphingomonas liriopis TaxID=2949094 RepID=A0A9X2HUR4_9SPHN|nr:EthD domain-containing protein [Sphingomonas liriopis]MCP3735884.1 EthD domain-containing protein [Sphingomonas liriopis]